MEFPRRRRAAFGYTWRTAHLTRGMAMPAAQTERIADLCQRIVDGFQPERIVLFGSFAYGEPTPWSDVDLLVIMPHQGSARQAAATILQHVQPDFGVDLLVRSPAEVAQRLAMGDYFMQEIMDRGRVLYEADHVGVG
jgi:predicted nucleotidyltransferase